MHRKEKIIITCGTFDPLTVEELKFLKKCKSKGEWLIVGVHSDWWMAWSQGGYVQDYASRREIVSSLECVDEKFSFNDSDGTIIQLLKLVKILIKYLLILILYFYILKIYFSLRH